MYCGSTAGPLHIAGSLFIGVTLQIYCGSTAGSRPVDSCGSTVTFTGDSLRIYCGSTVGSLHLAGLLFIGIWLRIYRYILRIYCGPVDSCGSTVTLTADSLRIYCGSTAGPLYHKIQLARSGSAKSNGPALDPRDRTGLQYRSARYPTGPHCPQ